ncbi:hypothetical protein AYJ54_29665 [Bradyrhizobium centrolobii]|uniref:Uncharacterized protein n=1 Tax=Bradyrhizobium centrolobii TaxID=1505087 RepID=A0A176YCU2_9BRAD|nr:hypothetical protein AYJ54_29665 [Bradyrhizobium centrolobii]
MARSGSIEDTKASPVQFVTIFTVTMSAVSAVICAIVRGPLGGAHWLAFAKAFLLLAAIVSTVTLTLSFVERHGRSYAGVLMAALAVLFLNCLALPFGRVADLFIDPILLALAVLGIRQTVIAARAMPFRHKLPAVSLGVLAGLGYFLVINARGLASVLSPEQAIVGVQNLDTLFHAAIANMLVNYGTVSMGMDGLVPVTYHFLSHIWLGCLGRWLGSGTYQAYFIGAQVVAIPLLFFSLFLAAYLLRPRGERLRSGALLALAPLFLLFCTEMWNTSSYLFSESYFLAAIIFLLSLPLFAEISTTASRRRLCIQAGCVAVVGLLMEMSKVSVGVVFLPAAGYLLLRQLALKARTLLMLGAAALVLAAVAAFAIFRAMGGSLKMVDPLNFLWEYPELAWPSLVANFVLLCATIVVWIVSRRADRLCAEAFAIMALAASIPSVLLVIPGGSAYYFIHVGTFAAVVFVVAYAGPWLEHRVPSLFRPELLVAALVLVTLDTPQKIRSPIVVGEEWAELARRTSGYLGNATDVGDSTRKRLGTLLLPGSGRRRALAEDMMRLPRAQSIKTLRDRGLADAPGSAVFVPPENVPFWSYLQDCRTVSEIIPALLGVPMIRGLNPTAAECRNEANYGFPAYGPDSVSQPTSDDELCAHATRWGLRTVFVLARPTEVRRIDCRR